MAANKRFTVLTIAFGVVLFSLGVVYLYKLKQNNNPITSSPPTHNECLADNEVTSYQINKGQGEVNTATIFIKNKETNQEIFKFTTELPLSGHYHPIEMHKCGVYTTKSFNYDYKKKQALADYRIELWHYKYNGLGAPMVFLSGPISGSGFSTDFRVDSNERYLALTKGYFGSSDYAVVIKDLKTLKDVFALPISEIEKNKPDIASDMQFEDWSRDGHYLWIKTAYGANVLGFIRIDSEDWSVDFFKAPKDVLGGDALNLENGYITVHPGNVWFGIKQMTDEEKDKRRAKGIGTELYVENLLTKRRFFVDKTGEPLWYFKPKWVSDTELQYEMLSGEKKIYVIPK